MSTKNQDLLDRLLNPAISTFLVKGNPGTGKTTLALELLKRKGKGVYIATRVTTEKLVAQNPNVKIVSTGVVPDKISVGDSKLGTKDYQLAGSRDIMTLVFETVLDRTGGLIILDSWDSIAKELPLVERSKVEKAIVTGIQASTWTLGFIAEESSMTTTDYLVDAVVELHCSLTNDYIQRELEVKKLRGQKIDRPLNPYTLDGGIFQIFEPVKLGFPGKKEIKKFVHRKNIAGMFSSGISDVDRMIGGGFRPGTIATLEYAKGVSHANLTPLFTILSATIVANGGCVVVLPPAGTPPGAMVGILRKMLPPELVNENIRVGLHVKYDDPCYFHIGSESVVSTMESINEVIDEIKAGDKKKPCLVMIAASKLEYFPGKDRLDSYLITLATKVRARGDLLAFLVDHTMETKDVLAQMSDFHLLFRSLQDVLTMQSLNPFGPIFVMNYDYSKGYPELSFSTMD